MKLYQIFINIVAFLIPTISLFNKKIKLIIKDQKDNFNKFKNLNLNKDKKTLWFHVASAGEYLQASSLIKFFRENNYNIILSYTSISCKPWLEKYKIYDFSFILPIDTKKNISSIINILRPNALILTRYDIWPNLISELYNSKIPIFLNSASLNLKKLKFFKNFYLNLYKKITLIFAIDEEEVLKFKNLSLNNVILSSDTKYDYVLQRVNSSIDLSLDAKLKSIRKKYSKIIVIGSSWAKDEEIAIAGFKNLIEIDKNILLILVPHELDRILTLENKLKKNNLNHLLFSNLSHNISTSYNVLLVDEMGILLDIYRIANYAFIGSGAAGVHNVLEAYFLNIPLAFRNKYYNSKEAISLVKAKEAKLIKNKEDFISFINNTKKNHTQLFRDSKINLIYNKIKEYL